jgi:glycosyltransferase involved in cell wall biosynthesis
MRIAVSVFKSLKTTDGASVRAKRIYDVLASSGYDVTLIATDDKDFIREGAVLVSPARTKLWNLKLIPVIINNKYDCVYCSWDFLGFVTYCLFSKLYKYKVIFEAHGILSEEFKTSFSHTLRSRFIINIEFRAFQALEKFAVKRADVVIALSSDVYNFYKKFRENIELIPVFVDEEKFKANRESISTHKRTGEKVIGLIGSFDQKNINMHFLDFLYSNLDQFDERIRFVIIGTCDNKINDKHVLYTDYLEDVQQYVDQLTLLDAVLVPALFPTFGPCNKILESMACSVPVFTTPIGAMGLDHITNGEHILIFDESELVDKVNTHLFDEELMGHISNNARRIVEAYYSTKVNKAKITHVIDGLI